MRIERDFVTSKFEEFMVDNDFTLKVTRHCYHAELTLFIEVRILELNMLSLTGETEQEAVLNLTRAISDQVIITKKGNYIKVPRF